MKAVVFLRREAEELAKKIAAGLSADCYPAGPDLPKVLPGLFRRYRGLVLIMAAGIAVRQIAPLLRGKDTDPGVVVVDEKGRYAVSLLGGHLGGANDLARQVASITGGEAVVTTATDVHGLEAVDTLAARCGLRPDPPGRIKEVNLGILRGLRPKVYSDLADAGEWFSPWGPVRPLAEAAGGPATVLVTDRELKGISGLYLRPRRLVVGVGARRGVSAGQLLAFLAEVFSENSLARGGIALIASARLKEDEGGILQLAEEIGVPVVFYGSEELEKTIRQRKLSVSVFAKRKVGVSGVCEPAAILGAQELGKGRPVRILAGKKAKEGMTLAVATWL